jgi:hypothetical protein
VKKILLAVFGTLLLAGAAAAQDVITVGTVTADGPNVDVPVFIRDTSGTPLGVDRPAGSKIQAFSIKVNYSPVAAVSSVTFTRAGITQNLSPSFEVSPSSSGSISLLETFSESTAPIPFNLNANPGDQVAHLSFTLSSSATPGTPITLTLDSSTTQLSNQGGTTSETTSNGGLALTNGQINIPVPNLALSPSSQTVTAGTTAVLSADTDQRLVASTTVNLSSSNPAVATVPSSVTISAGSHTASVPVTTLSPGSTVITATLAQSAGGATSNATVTVNAAPICNTPAVPVISAPATALVGATYTVSWAAVADATEYLVDEATDASFNNATTKTVTTTSASYSHNATGKFFYRVRARNHSSGCDVSSAVSISVSVQVSNAPQAPAPKFLAVVGSTPGNFGSFFKTSLQMYNPRTTTVSGKIVFHPQGASGSASDPSMAYALAPGKTLFFADLLPAMGVASGLGTADLTGDVGSALPLALARVFNDAGAAGTTGLSENAEAAEQALSAGKSGTLFAPADITKFRLNIGVRTLEQGATMNVTVRDKDGVVVKTITAKNFAATFFTQPSSSVFLDGFNLVGGETITIDVTAGSAFVYGSTTDNTTNDPSVQFARAND